jgi:FeS assembly SUF system protein
MSDDRSNPPPPPQPVVSLPVLPNSGKVEQLRAEAAAGEAASAAGSSQRLPANHPDQTVIDRALDPNKTPKQKAIEERVIEVLRTVYDPEIPINIYELGLIYEIKVDPTDSSVFVKMTLTAPGCPVAGSLPPEVERKVETIPEVPRATVELVWDPPWTKQRMSEAAMLELGLS